MAVQSDARANSVQIMCASTNPVLHSKASLIDGAAMSVKIFSSIANFFGGLAYNIKAGFLWVFGKIRVYPWPMFMVFDPKGYKIKADGIRKAMKMARAGDVFARRYVSYLDGMFIPGRFSHTGVYVGNGIIIHAMGDGVQKIDVIDFLRCDGYAMLRPKCDLETKKRACEIAESYLGCEYDYNFDITCDYKNKEEVESRTKSVYCHELTRSCFPTLDVPTIKPSLWHGMIRSSKLQFLAQSFFESPDFEVVYDSDFSEPKDNIK